VDFKNTVIIMTSNLGSAEIAAAKKSEKQQEILMKILPTFFRPEFLNRIDDIVIFQRLTKEELAQIVELQIAEVQKRLKKKGIDLEISKMASMYLAVAGFDEVFGARPLKRLIQTKILDELAMEIIEGKIVEGDKVLVDFVDDQILVRKNL
jgi:ATP-dependent Clp protease ATP-binding subunit ClpB